MNKYLDALKGYQLALQMSGTLVCSIFGSLGAGIWLDKTLGTTPWLMLLLMVVGIIGSTYTIYRIAKESK